MLTHSDALWSGSVLRRKLSGRRLALCRNPSPPVQNRIAGYRRALNLSRSECRTRSWCQRDTRSKCSSGLGATRCQKG